MIMLDNTVVNVALPSIQRDLGVDISELEWIVTGYALTFAAFMLSGGKLADYYGRRLIFVLGIVIFTLASFACGMADSGGVLIGARIFQGVGAALMNPATLSIVTNAFEPSERGKAIGTWAGVSALALAIGPVVGGLLTEHVSWRAIFYLNIQVAAGAIAATIFAVRESRDESVGREIDYLGVGTLTVGLTSLVLALIESNAWGWSSARIVGLLVLSVVALTAFVFIERRVPAPIVELPLFASRNFVATNVVALVVTFAMMAQFFFVTLYIQDVLGYSPVETGLRFLPSTLMIVLIAPIAGRMTDRIGPRWLIGGGLAIVTVSLFWLTTINSSTTYGDIWPSFVLMGIGMALVMSPMSTAAMNAVPVTKAGVASGLLSMNRMVGGSLGVAVVGAVFASQAPAGVQDPTALVNAFSSAMWVTAGVAALGAIVAIALIRGKAERPAPVEESAAATTSGGELATGELALDRV
jgi:EmrB/QacA subfamily drug resistance transporter